MTTTAWQSLREWFGRGRVLRIGLLVLSSILALIALVLPIALRPASYSLDVGDVSSVDIQAPRAITFDSSVLTEQARTDAAQAVPEVYLPADASIARRQIERLGVALAYITTVRYDLYATQDQKLTDLDHLQGIHLNPDTARHILQLNDNHWQGVEQEAVTVLEQLMRSTLREDKFADVLRSIPSLVSFTLPQDQAAIVTELVTAFTVPNSLYSPEQTQAARNNVRNSIAPISRAYASGETIVRRGQIISAAIHEALVQYDLIRPKNQYPDYIAAAALVILAATFIGLYFHRRQPTPLNDMRSLIVIAVVFLIFLIGARFIIPNRTVIPYLYPIPAFGLTIAALFNVEIGLVLSLVLSVLSAYGLQNSLDLTIFYLFSSLCGVLLLGRAHRIANFFWSGIAIGVAGTGVILAYRLVESVIDWLGLATLAGASLLNGLESASLTLLIQFLLSQLLSLTTALQLLEISRPDHPLLQFLLRNAPGTYQHSLQVANLAEQAAETIGADGLLTRVGAIYHDAGKAMNPIFFVENQPQGKLNPHDDLNPATSAATIIKHVEDGLLLARRHRLPPKVREFICEHHGTLLTKYQYTRAVELVGGDPNQVDTQRFRYPGPRPQSRETALLMLADGCEARARAELPKDDVELRKIIQAVFDRCQKEGQLDDTHLTLRDLSAAAESFHNSLKSLYHQRIIYPELPQTYAASAIPTQPLPAPKNAPSLPASVPTLPPNTVENS
jgi:hypothetical protein